MWSFAPWRALSLILCVLALGAAASPARAIVDMNSASYSNSWYDVDASVTGVRVLRAYKSRTLYNGIFGFGWCSEMETVVRPFGPEVIVLTHCGDGQEVVYVADYKPGARAITDQVRRVLDADARLAASRLNDEDRAILGEQIFGLGSEIAARAGLGGRRLPLGRFVATNGDVLVSTAAGATTQTDGLRFDRFGNVTSTRTADGSKLTIIRAAKRWTVRSQTGAIDLHFNDDAAPHVTSITHGDNLLSTYRYVDDTLVHNKNHWGSEYNYEYNEYRNLTRATWPDGSDISIEYDNERDWVIGFRDRSNCHESYDYQFGPWRPDGALGQRLDALIARLPPITIDPGERFSFSSHVVKKCGDAVVANNHYYFNHAPADGGGTVLQRLVTLIGSNQGRAILYRLDDGTARYVVDESLDTPSLWTPPGSLSARKQYGGIIQVRTVDDCSDHAAVEYWPESGAVPRHVALWLRRNGEIDSTGNCVLSGIDLVQDGTVTPLRIDYVNGSVTAISVGDRRFVAKADAENAFALIDPCLGIDRAARGERLLAAVRAARAGGACSDDALARGMIGVLSLGNFELPYEIAF